MIQPQNKGLHPSNIHNQGYDFDKLTKHESALKDHLLVTPAGKKSIDFKDNKAVFLLNKALLKTYYGLQYWSIVPNSLCPPVSGRADYIHYVADLIHLKKKAQILDIGTGSGLIYPILGNRIYGWRFIASDTHRDSLENARTILDKNPAIKGHIDLRFQPDTAHILKNIIHENDYFEAIVCNPPFYKSREEHWKKVVAKNEKLFKGQGLPSTNFGGLANELWYPGGEKAFITKMIYESFEFRKQIGWCTCIVSDKDHIKPLVAVLEYHKTPEVKIIPMQQGQKVTRILAWRLN